MDKEPVYKVKKVKISGFTEKGRNKNLLKQKEFLEKKGWEYVSYEEHGLATFRKEVIVKKESKTTQSIKSALLFLIIIFFIIFVGKCTSCLLDPPSISPTKNTSQMVNWNNYSPIVKERIQKYISEGNCKQLQIEFNSAYKNNDQQHRRTDENNSKLLSFIDENMRKLGCFN